jgi:hypothetical protein
MLTTRPPKPTNKYSRQENNCNYKRHYMRIPRCAVNETHNVKSIISVNVLIMQSNFCARYKRNIESLLRPRVCEFEVRTHVATQKPFVERYCYLLPLWSSEGALRHHVSEDFTLSLCNFFVNGAATPLQAGTDPEYSRSLRLSDLNTIGT